MPYGQMTVKELAERLNKIIEQNEKRGWHERNNLPVAVRVKRMGKRRRLRDHYYTAVCYADGSKLGLGKHGDYCGVMIVEESNLLKL